MPHLFASASSLLSDATQRLQGLRALEWLSDEKAARMITVTDSLECKQPHEVEVFWHFAETCELDIVGSEVVAHNMGVVL